MESRSVQLPELAEPEDLEVQNCSASKRKFSKNGVDEDDGNDGVDENDGNHLDNGKESDDVSDSGVEDGGDDSDGYTDKTEVLYEEPEDSILTDIVSSSVEELES